MTTPVTTSRSSLEAGTLATQMASSFAQLVDTYKRHFHLPHDEAVAKASKSDAEDLARIQHGPPDQVSWYDLERLANYSHERATVRWEEIKHEALLELQSGHRAFGSVEVCNETPWIRAQFLALRTELATEWQPRNGIERQLIDTMAQAQTSYMFWLQVLTTRATLENVSSERRRKEHAKWEAPRQTEAEAFEQAAGMVDRFNRIFLRTLRALRDSRRQGTPVILQSGGQLNVAHQQVNLAGQTQDQGGTGTDKPG